MSNKGSQPSLLLRIFCCMCQTSTKRRDKAVRPKLKDVVNRNSSEKIVINEVPVDQKCKISIKRMRTINDISRANKSPKIGQEEQTKSISDRRLKTFGNSGDFSDPEMTTILIGRRKSWSNSQLTPFLDPYLHDQVRGIEGNKLTDKQQKRDFKLNKALNIFGSRKSKLIFNPNSGLTSVGLSTKKESKLTEDLEKTINREVLCNKLLPSPVVALDKREPKKSTSKNSKNSKKSGKSSKNVKRVPKKYTNPNFSKEKFSNKTLTPENIGSCTSPIIVCDLDKPATSFETTKEVFDRCTKVRENSKVNDNKEKKNKCNHTPADFTIKNVGKHGIILEEQDESLCNSSNQNSVSGNDSDDSEVNSNYLPEIFIQLKKTESHPVQLQNKLFKGDVDSMKETLAKLTKKDDNCFSLKEAELAVPKRDSHPHSACHFSNMNVNSPTSSINSAKVSNKSMSMFHTDLNLLKKCDENTKCKAVLSRLKMMI